MIDVLKSPIASEIIEILDCWFNDEIEYTYAGGVFVVLINNQRTKDIFIKEFNSFFNKHNLRYSIDEGDSLKIKIFNSYDNRCIFDRSKDEIRIDSIRLIVNNELSMFKNTSPYLRNVFDTIKQRDITANQAIEVLCKALVYSESAKEQSSKDLIDCMMRSSKN